MAAWTTTPRTWSVGETVTAANMNAQLRDFANAFGAWGSYTPTWGATSAPTIGSGGTITGGYSQIQKTVNFRVGVTFGTGTTFGSGNYTLTIPVTTGSGLSFWSFLGYALQSSTGYQLTLDVNGGSSTAVLNYQSSTAGVKTRVSPTAPVTWTNASGNGFWFSGTYEAA